MKRFALMTALLAMMGLNIGCNNATDDTAPPVDPAPPVAPEDGDEMGDPADGEEAPAE